MKLEAITQKIALIGVMAIALCMTTGAMALAGISKDTETPPTAEDIAYCELCHANGANGDATDVGTCVECHSCDATEPTYDKSTYELTGGGQTVIVPVVNYTGASAPSAYLAGGNFYWVRSDGGDDAMGHNVFADNSDDNLSVAPGASNGVACGTNSCHENLNVAPTAMSGRNGCQSCHLEPAHHTSSSGYVNEAPWFRWLSGHQGGATLGVKGIEDDDWNYETSTDHNEYLGNVATKTSAGGFSACGSTMTGYCTGCHGDFHIERDDYNTYWTRHPADHVIPTSGEYDTAFGSAGSGANGVWDPTVPVARPAGFSWAGETSSNVVKPGTDMVMCLSCHVAHGSPYPKMLRWDMTNMTGACSTCHTSLKK